MVKKKKVQLEVVDGSNGQVGIETDRRSIPEVGPDVSSEQKVGGKDNQVECSATDGAVCQEVENDADEAHRQVDRRKDKPRNEDNQASYSEPV